MKAIVLLALCVGAVLSASVTLYPTTADGFDTVFLDDMSFVTELNYQTFGPNGTNITLYAYGGSRIRTVYPGTPSYSYSVGSTPNENWNLPFIDFHTFQNGTDVWGIGPINPTFGRNRANVSGYQFEIAAFTTKYTPGNSRQRFFIEQPLGFEGTFYSTRVIGFDPNNVHAYFAGFFPTAGGAPGALSFGIRRGHFNMTLFTNDLLYNGTQDAWTFNSTVDDCPLYSNAQLITFNEQFKPWILHARDVDNSAPPNSSWIVLVDPYMSYINLIMTNYDPTVPLVYTNHTYIPIFGAGVVGKVVSTVVYDNLLFVGVSVSGMGTGWIDVIYLANLTRKAQIMLPANYSDPRALVLDYFDPNPVIYVGMNGGWSILRFNISILNFTGYQSLPYYLHRTWNGVATHEHIYFVTNEQHSKIYRMSKADFCPTQCMEYGYCQKGRCVCGPNLVKQGDQCTWKTIVQEKHTISVEKGGEIALGIFFAISLVAAAAGWYMVWKSRRGTYQAVA